MTRDGMRLDGQEWCSHRAQQAATVVIAACRAIGMAADGRIVAANRPTAGESPSPSLLSLHSLCRIDALRQ